VKDAIEGAKKGLARSRGLATGSRASLLRKVSELVDFIVARILDQLDIDNDLSPRWGH
jgi:hypothetical protein